MENNENNQMSQEEKEMVLKDTQKYADELKDLEKMQKDISSASRHMEEDSAPKRENYDIEKSRHEIKKKGRVINRRLGYHRRYLYSDVKISNIVLLIIFIVLSILVICKFAIPERTPTSQSNIVATSEAKFGNNIEMKTDSDYKDGVLKVKVTVKNNEKVTIKFNPASIKLKHGDNIYIPALSDKDKAAVSPEGLPANSKAMFTLKYNIDEGSVTNSSLETIVVGGQETCILVTSLGL